MKSIMTATIALLLAAPPDPAALFASGDFPGAADAARTTLARSPGDARALLVAGTLALYRNDLPAASADFSRIPPGSSAAPARERLVAEVQRRERLARRSDVMFGRARDVTKFARTLPLPVIPVSVNGHRVLFQIDTGAPGIALDRDFAKSLALPPAPAHHGTFADGKLVAIPEARVAVLGLGQAAVRDLSADLLPLHELTNGSEPIDGVLGAGVLERFSGFTLDYANGELVTYSPSANIAAEAETNVPLYLIGDHFLAVRSAIAGIDGISLIDTGLIGAGIVPSKDVVERAHLAVTDAGLGTVPNGAHQRVSSVTVPEVRIGASVEHDIAGFYAPGPSLADRLPFAVNGTISHGIFERRSVTFDLRRMRLSISARATKRRVPETRAAAASHSS